MRTLVINDHGVFIGVKGDRVAVRKGGEKIIEIAAGKHVSGPNSLKKSIRVLSIPKI
ncbi:MAG: hypothetical protein FGF51_02560 [Candidatus Brockarchaeota archaeon]|nr:hypothetical protein [Candidatus Brockarchaeota archaeon]MBO3809102.1 hypothetical protein [Candidatus Brockarchaeota archaeon]MBO3832255.1 hypothetical protein [Candidatus Brockarchaeota archaeon]